MVLDIPAASAESGVSVPTIHRWIKTKRLTPVSTKPFKVRAADVRAVRDRLHVNKLRELFDIPV